MGLRLHCSALALFRGPALQLLGLRAVQWEPYQQGGGLLGRHSGPQPTGVCGRWQLRSVSSRRLHSWRRQENKVVRVEHRQGNRVMEANWRGPTPFSGIAPLWQHLPGWHPLLFLLLLGQWAAAPQRVVV
jgi:hypothetical protein